MTISLEATDKDSEQTMQTLAACRASCGSEEIG